MANFNESDERLQSYSNEGDSEDLSLIPSSDVHYVLMEPEQTCGNDHSEHYMVLYNGNAEVIGNFRALNFYKASDMRIKEDARLLIDNEYDPRSVLLKIDGVSYKFKHGTTNAPMNRRFVGYIAQQIESVVPEAVQLIDGILHVDYESLIPYLSESIKQNFRDISDLKTDASQIHKVVDMMYAEFVNKEHKKSSRSGDPLKRKSRNRSVRWIIGTSITVLLALSIAIGAFFVVPLLHPTPDSKTNGPSDPSTPSTNPSSPTTPDLTSPPISSQALPTLPSLDQDVLLELYNATNGQKWYPNPPASVCEWQGVMCDEDLRVVVLTLSSFNMRGTLPESIGKLDKLRTMFLSMNPLTGTIPTSIGNLTNLIELDLSTTEFTGSVPAELFSLPSLQTLSLNYAQSLSWTIPPQIANLKSLRFFTAVGSGLHGTIPDGISQLQNLTLLALERNELTGSVPSLANASIKTLSLNNNYLTGPMPELNPNLHPLHTLAVYIDLTNNRNLTGEFHLPLNYWQDAAMNQIIISRTGFTSLSPTLQQFNFSSIAQCRAKDVPFRCPIPAWFATRCQATCVN